MSSQECGKIVQMVPHRFSISPTFQCDPNGAEVSFRNLYLTICLEGMLWGFGTALGELPPYIVAKTASLSGGQTQELNENEGKMKQIQEKIFGLVRRHPFSTVLILASIPNPLFDLAGLTCGHLQISFLTFFTATAIGKSLIKINLQILAILLAFSQNSINLLERALEKYLGEGWGLEF